MTKKIGITGIIGSGKSTVAHLFELMGIPVYIADMEARKLFLKPDVIDEIIKITGTEILDAQQQINRSMLADLLFSNSEMLTAVNHIIHPRVITDYQQWSLTQNQVPFTLFESAIIFEHQLESNFDAIINVSCPETMAISRAVKRDHQTEEQIRSRLSHQLSSEIKNQKSDFIIYTDDRHSIIYQVSAIYSQLSSQTI